MKYVLHDLYHNVPNLLDFLCGAYNYIHVYTCTDDLMYNYSRVASLHLGNTEGM